MAKVTAKVTYVLVRVTLVLMIITLFKTPIIIIHQIHCPNYNMYRESFFYILLYVIYFTCLIYFPGPGWLNELGRWI